FAARHPANSDDQDWQRRHGNRTRIRVTKNKVAPPFKEAEFDIMFAEGISKVGDILDIGTTMEIIDKKGAFYRYNNGLLGQGREASKEFLRKNPLVANEIEMAIRTQYGLMQQKVPASE